jgi:hypothetical protein
MSLRDFGLGIGNIRVAGIFPNQDEKPHLKLKSAALDAVRRLAVNHT